MIEQANKKAASRVKAGPGMAPPLPPVYGLELECLRSHPVFPMPRRTRGGVALPVLNDSQPVDRHCAALAGDL